MTICVGHGGFMLLVGVLIGAGVASAQPVSINPLTMADRGMVQCYRPDVQSRTCHSIAGYRRTGPGNYDNKALLPLSEEVTLEVHTDVVIKGDAVCGFIRAQDLASATLRISDQVVDSLTAKPILARMAQNLKSLAGKEICTRYVPAGADFTAKVSVAGVYQPTDDETVKWVSEADGYTVVP